MFASSCTRLLLLVATFGVLGPGAAIAENPLERHLFTGYIPTFRSGDAVPKEGVFEIALKPVADIVYLSRSRDVASAGYGALVTLETVSAGRYALILSNEARLAVVQPRTFRSIPVFPGSTEYDAGLATFTTDGGPLTLQVSGVVAPRIMVAIVPMPDQP